MRKVEATENIKASPETIISAFTDPKMLNGWWGVERTLIEKKIGGLYTLAWNVKDQTIGFVSTGLIKEYNPQSTLFIENMVYLNPGKPFLGPMTLKIIVKNKGSFSELFLCQDGYQSGPDWDWYYEAVKQAWPAVLQNLKRYLEENKV